MHNLNTFCLNDEGEEEGISGQKSIAGRIVLLRSWESVRGRIVNAKYIASDTTLNDLTMRLTLEETMDQSTDNSQEDCIALKYLSALYGDSFPREEMRRK